MAKNNLTNTIINNATVNAEAVLNTSKKTRRKQAKKKRLFKPKVKMYYPRSAEREYYKVLRGVARKLRVVTREKISTMTQALRGMRADSVRKDLLEEIQQAYLESGTKEEAMEYISQICERVDHNTRKNLIRAFEQTMGVDVIISEIGEVEDIEDEWKDLQESYVDEIETSFFSKLGVILGVGLVAGSLYSEISDQIDKVFDQIDLHAQRIAINEIGNLNSATTEAYQEGAGISFYMWQTMQDEKVRESHMERDGKYFFWGNMATGSFEGETIYPTPDHHPSEDFNCRCIAIPIIDMDNWDYNAVTPMGMINPNSNCELGNQQ